MSSAILVTGSRSWTDREAIAKVVRENPPGVLIHGAAPGADTIADEMARPLGCILVIPMPANWKKYGPRAGPMRNEAMLCVLQALAGAGFDCEVHGFPLSNAYRKCRGAYRH